MSKIILILGILLATSYFGETDNLPDSGTKISRNVWFPAIAADSAFSKNTIDTNNRDKRSMTMAMPMQNNHQNGNNDDNDNDNEDNEDNEEEIHRKSYKTKRCRGLPSYRKIKLYREPEEEIVSYAVKNPRSLDGLEPSRNIILQLASDKQISTEESEEEEQPYLRIAAIKNPKILKNILRSKSMQRYEETEINRDNAILKRVKTHLRPDDCNVLALIGKRAGSTRTNKPKKFVCYYDDGNCGNDAEQMVLQAYPTEKKAKPVFLNENHYDNKAIPAVKRNPQFKNFAQAPAIAQYAQHSVLTKTQNPIVGYQSMSGTLKTQNGPVLMDTGSTIQKQQFENIKNAQVLQSPHIPLNIQYGVPSGQTNWQELNKIASADSVLQRNGFFDQQIKPHSSLQTPFIQNYIGNSYSANNVIDQSNRKIANQQYSMEQKSKDEYVGIEQTVPRGGEKSWPIGRTELGKSFRNIEDCIKLYGREFCVADGVTLSQWKNDAVHKIGSRPGDVHLSSDYSDLDTPNYASTPLSDNYGHHNEKQTVDSNYQYDSTSLETPTHFQYTSEQPFVAQAAPNKIIKGSDQSYETVTRDFGYSDHNDEQMTNANYQYDSTGPVTPIHFQYSSGQPIVAQTAPNKIIQGSDQPYEPVTRDFGYSTDHNEDQMVGSNYEYDSTSLEAPTYFQYTSEQPFVAQAAQNKIIKGSDESYESVTKDFEYSDHNDEQMTNANYQYDSTSPETPIHFQYSSGQPIVAQTAPNKIIQGSDQPYEPVTRDFGYSTDNNEDQMVGSNYEYDSTSLETPTHFQYTSEQPFVAQAARNKIIKGSDESYESVTRDLGYSTDHNEEQIIGSNNQYEFTSPETPTNLQYTSGQPFVAQAARNKIIKGSDESYESVTKDFGYSYHNDEQMTNANYQYDSTSPETPIHCQYSSGQPIVGQTAPNKIIQRSDQPYEPVTKDFGYSTDHNEEQIIGSNYQYDFTSPETPTNFQYTSGQPIVAQAAQNKIIKGADSSYETIIKDFRYSPNNDFIEQLSNYDLKDNSKQRIQANPVQNAQHQIDKNSHVGTSDYYDNTGSQNSHVYQYEENAVRDNNMKYNGQSLSHDIYENGKQKYLLGQKQKPNLKSDSKHQIIDSTYTLPVTPYENDNSFSTTVNNLQNYNEYHSDDKNDLKYPVVVSDDTKESNYAENTEPYTDNRYYSAQPEYYAMTEMPQSIHRGESVAPSSIPDIGIPSLAQTEPAEHPTYPENTLERPLQMANNQYEQIQRSHPSYNYLPSHQYGNLNYYNEPLNNHPLGKAYTTQDFGNIKYINNPYSYNNYPNFYDTRLNNFWKNSERILSPNTGNGHIAADNNLRKTYEGIQEHQSSGLDWNSERFSSPENSKESAAADHTEITETSNGYSFVDDFDKAHGMHTGSPISSTDLFINDQEDQFNPKLTDINDSQIERQHDIMGPVVTMDSLEKFVDSTGNVLHSVEFQTDKTHDIHSPGDPTEDLLEMENSAAEVTSAESRETPYAERDSSRDLAEKCSPSISVDLTSPRSREYFITETSEEGTSTPLQDLVEQSLHEESTEHSAETYGIGSKDLDVKYTGNTKSTIYATEGNLNSSIDLPTDQEPPLLPDIVGESFGERTVNKNTCSCNILKSVAQNSDVVNFNPIENAQSVIYGTGENLIASVALPKDKKLTSGPDIIGKSLSQEISGENTDSYTLVIPNIETTDFTPIEKSAEDNKDIMESDNGVVQSPITGNSKNSVLNNNPIPTTKEYLLNAENYLKATIKSVINNFASNASKDIVGSGMISESSDLLPEIINTPMLKTLLALPDVENALIDMVQDTLSRSPYGTKYRSFLKLRKDAIKSAIRDVIGQLENSLPTDYPIAVEEHEFKHGKWVTEQVTLLPTVPEEQRVQIPFSETVNRIILQTLKSVIESPVLGSKAANHPVVRNIIVGTIKNALRKADVNTASIEDATLRDIVDKFIQKTKADVPSATENLRDSSIAGQSTDEDTNFSMTENNSELEKWTTTDNIQTQMEKPENLSTKNTYENNDEVPSLTSTDNSDEKSAILGHSVDMSYYDNPKELSLLNKKLCSHVSSTNPKIDDAETATEDKDYKMLGEFSEEKYHHLSTESNDEYPLKSLQSQIFDNNQADDSAKENVQAVHSTSIENNFPLKSSEFSNLDKVEIDKSIEENVQEAQSTPSSEKIMDDILALTKYPDLTLDNDHAENILGMTGKLPTNSYNGGGSLFNTESLNNSPAISAKTIGEVSSNPVDTNVYDLLEKAPIQYYSPNDRMLQYRKNHLPHWNPESMTSRASSNDMVKGTIIGPHRSCSYSVIRNNGNDYDENNDTSERMNSAQYGNNESQNSEYIVGNNRKIITPNENDEVDQEMKKSETSSAVLEGAMNLTPSSKINDDYNTETQTENQEFTANGIVGFTEPQDTIEEKYINSNLGKTEIQDTSNGEYISSVPEENTENDSMSEKSQEENMFDETAINTSLDEGTFSHVQDDSKLAAKQQKNVFFETTIHPSSDEETFVQPEQYDESEMATDVSEEENSRSNEYVNLAEPKESAKSLEKVIDSEEVSDVNDTSDMAENTSDEEISKSEDSENVGQSSKNAKSVELINDSEEMNDLDNESHDTAETAEDLNNANSSNLNNDDYDLAESEEYSSKMESAQENTFKKNLRHDSSISQYLGTSNGNTEDAETIPMKDSTQLGNLDLRSSNQNKILEQTKRKGKLIPTKSREIVTKTIKKTITKTTKYYGAEGSNEDSTVNSPNDEIVSATKTSCFPNSEHDITYFGKLVPKYGRNQGNDVSELANSDLYYIGDGVRLPLTIKKLDDGSYGLSISEKVCEHFMNTKCPCCVPRDGTIVSEKRNSHEGRNLKRDIWKLSKESSLEGERDSNEKIQEKIGKSKTRYTRATPAAISGTQENDRIITPERHSASFRSMPVEAFAKKYNLILNLAKRSTKEDVREAITETVTNNKTILNNDKENEPEEKNNFTEIMQNASSTLNEKNRNEIADGNQASSLVKSLISINNAPESERADIVLNALENLIKTEPTEIYTIVNGQQKEMETLNMNQEDEDADAARDEEIAKYGYQKDNPILDRIKFIKAKLNEQSQHKYQEKYDDDVTKKMDILKVILHWLKDVILRIPLQNKT